MSRKWTQLTQPFIIFSEIAGRKCTCKNNNQKNLNWEMICIPCHFSWVYIYLLTATTNTTFTLPTIAHKMNNFFVAKKITKNLKKILAKKFFSNKIESKNTQNVLGLRKKKQLNWACVRLETCSSSEMH